MSCESHPSFHFLRKRLPSFPVLSGLLLTDGRHNPDTLIGLLSYPTVWDSLAFFADSAFLRSESALGPFATSRDPAIACAFLWAIFRNLLRQSTLSCWRFSLLPCR